MCSKGFTIFPTICHSAATEGRRLHRLVSRYRRRYLACLLEPLGDPYLDDRLPRHPKTAGFAVQRFDHPLREVHVHATLLLVRSRGGRHIEVVDNVLDAIVKFLVKLTSFHKPPPPRDATFV